MLPAPSLLARSLALFFFLGLPPPVAHTPLPPTPRSAACDTSVCSQGRRSHGLPSAPGARRGAGIRWLRARYCGCAVERAGWERGRRPEPPLGLGGRWVKADLVGEGGRSSEDKRDEPEKSCTLVETLQNCLRSQLSSRKQANLGEDVDQITCLTEEETEAWAWGGGEGHAPTHLNPGLLAPGLDAFLALSG